ncbi:MAG: ribF [Caulobacteraceae bacterium]|nr:ribF [Caulobacteraceae bacterium]
MNARDLNRLTIEIIETWRDLSPEQRGAAIALGNFDGVHRGHAAVIADAARAAATLGAPLAAMTFEPHPRLMFQPGAPPFRLTSPGQQARALQTLGVERLYRIRFDADLAAMSDRQFAQAVLADGLGARHVAVGFDISFGKGRSGSAETMRAYGEEMGFSVSVTEALGAGAEKFSSTAVREALRDGRPQEAAQILGRPFAIEGVVEVGRQLGRTLGYPTANIGLGDYVRPAFGVYVADVRLPDGAVVRGAANIGINPTMEVTEPRLEVYLLDFSADLYGKPLEVELIGYLRPEIRFDNLNDLTAQIEDDVKIVGDYKRQDE